MISRHDKWSRLIICLRLTAWQLIKALQGCIICSVPTFSVEIQTVLQGLWGGETSLRWWAEHDQTGAIEKRSRYRLTFMTEHALVALKPKQGKRGRLFPPLGCDSTSLWDNDFLIYSWIILAKVFIKLMTLSLWVERLQSALHQCVRRNSNKGTYQCDENFLSTEELRQWEFQFQRKAA